MLKSGSGFWMSIFFEEEHEVAKKSKQQIMRIVMIVNFIEIELIERVKIL